MRKLFGFFMLFAFLAAGANIFDATNDTVLVKTPATGAEAATKDYVDSHGGVATNAMTNLVLQTLAVSGSTYSNNTLYLGTNTPSGGGTCDVIAQNTTNSAGVASTTTNAGVVTVSIGTNLPAYVDSHGGVNAVVEIGSVVTLPAGSPAYVSNNVTGNTNSLDFGIPPGSNSTGSVTAVAINGVTNFPDGSGVVDLGTVSGGSGSQTPVTNDIDYFGYNATNMNTLTVSNITLRGTNVDFQDITNYPLPGLSYLVADSEPGYTNFYWTKIPASYEVYSNDYVAWLVVSPFNGKSQKYAPTNDTIIEPLSFPADDYGYQMMMTIETRSAVTFTNCTVASGSYVTNSGITAVLFDRWSGTSNWVVHTINP